MAYRTGEDINQMTLFPETLDEYIPRDHYVRAYDAFVDAMDLKEIGIEIDENKVGNSEYHPGIMFKILLYGYSCGIKSSRKMEKALYNDVTFMWLARRLTPDHKTIAEFRREKKEALKKGLKMCARLCLKYNLIEGNVIFLDGSKIRANAGRQKNHSYSWYKEQLRNLDKRIKELLNECEAIDEKEREEDSLVKMNKELGEAIRTRGKIEGIIRRMKEKEERTKYGKERTINMTDPESALMRSVHGSHASYNVQSVVDDKNGLIINVDAVSEGTDVKQFAEQIEKAEETLGKRCKVACADAGYANTEELKKIDEKGIRVIVPTIQQTNEKAEKPYSKKEFKYDKEENCYYCPEGYKLTYRGKQDRRKLQYLISEAEKCHKCRQYGICTTSKKGRKIVRLIDEEIKEKLERQYAEGQDIYKRRKQRVEHPFGHIKRNLGMTNFLMRGREGAQAEISIGAICFNIVRMINILGGVNKFIAKLNTA